MKHNKHLLPSLETDMEKLKKENKDKKKERAKEASSGDAKEMESALELIKSFPVTKTMFPERPVQAWQSCL